MRQRININFFVVVLSLIIGIGLATASWDIPFFPSDAEGYYLSAAAKVSDFSFPSEMHQGFDNPHMVWLHGKEALIIVLSFFQEIFGDYSSLRPLVILMIIAFCLSAILLFLIIRGYFGKTIGLICYIAFIFSIWPYVYVLFPKHQPFGLLCFLLSFYLLQKAKQNSMSGVLYFISGMFASLSLFSSPISPLYFPYYAAGFLYNQNILGWDARNFKIRSVDSLKKICFILLGFFALFIYFNYPNVLSNIKAYFHYVYLNASQNHFYYNQPIFQKWVPGGIAISRGGLVWIVRYFLLIMPVLFPVCITMACYVVWEAVLYSTIRKRIGTLGILLVCFSSPILAEIRGVSQYGANYFSSLIGFIMLIGFGLHMVRKRARNIKSLGGVVVFLLICHIGINIYLFASDVFPCRMAKTFVSNKIRSLGLKKFYTYGNSPNNPFFTSRLGQGVIDDMKLISNISQAQDGYILIPPITTTSMYNCNTTQTDFDLDPYFNSVIRKKRLEKYAIASFKTIASSKLWSQEEEMLSYMHLVLGSVSKSDLEKGFAWILDGEKLKKDIRRDFVDPDFFNLIFSGIRNIGRKESIYGYIGHPFASSKDVVFEGITRKIYKVGNPTDSLLAYVYSKTEDGMAFLPYGKDFVSIPVKSSEITLNSKGKDVFFRFRKPLILSPNSYFVVIYRTGSLSDKDFYRVYIDNPRLKNSYILSAVYFSDTMTK
ncbi:MAG: hypothetical protein P9M07_09005 [Candidatus Aceula meridiana]|nr:hypothetical protein [Candidatus Aceula meridiana]